MKKQLVLGFFLFLLIGAFAHTFQNKDSMMKDYKRLWGQVDKNEKNDLPKSALEIIDKILKKSISEKNISQTIKALIYKSKFQSEINSDESVQLFTDLEKLLSEVSDPSDKAFLHSLLGELYIKYYNANSWTIDQRTDLLDYVPADMEEWSKNIFYTKAINHLNQSVNDESALMKVKTKDYEEIIVLGDDSPKVYPTFYDFLMNRAIDITNDFGLYHRFSTPDLSHSLKQNNIELSQLALPTDEFVKLDFSNNDDLITLFYLSQYLKNLEKRNLKEAIVFTELKRNNYLTAKSETYRNKFALDFLTALKSEYTNYDYNVEVINDLVSQMDNNNIGLLWRAYASQEDTVLLKNKYNELVAGIKKYPKYERINLLKSRLDVMELGEGSIKGKSVYYPTSDDKEFTLNYKNINDVKLSIIDKNSNKTVWSDNIKLTPKTTYLSENISFKIDLDKVGDYKLEASFGNGKQYVSDSIEFRISELSYFSRTIDDDEYEFYVVDRKTGAPISDATVTIYSGLWSSSPSDSKKEYEVKTDAKGFAICNLTELKKANKDNGSRRFLYQVSKGNNDVSGYNDLSSYYKYEDRTDINRNDDIRIFTDRSIYRPGQTVYFKAVAVKYLDNKHSAPVVNKQYKAVFYNANRQVVAEKTFTTNEFGSFAGEFIVPQGALTGNYSIKVDRREIYISVEEYKRPTFEITFDKLDQTYAFGDQVTFVGHAENFSGIKLQNADVQYSIVKSPLFRWWSSGVPENIENGSVTTKDDGSFEITFTIPKNDSNRGFYGRNLSNFTLSATVTDTNGETQTGNTSVAVGDVSMVISTNIPDKIEKKSDEKITISAKNLNGQDVSAKGTYTIYSVQANDSINKAVETGLFATGEGAQLKQQIEKLSSGKYLLELKAKDDKGREVLAKNYFILYSADDKKPPIETNEWIIEKNTVFNDSENAEIIIGVSSKDVTILYDLMRGNKLLKRQQLKLSDENVRLKIPYEKGYKDNVTAVFTYVIDEVVYQKQINIVKKEEVKKLNLAWEVFRDKIRPGQKEEWSISVKDNDGKPAFAELLASMYDSSLDKLRSANSWGLSTVYNSYIYPQIFNEGGSFNEIVLNSSFNGIRITIPVLSWDYFNLFDNVDFNSLNNMNMRAFSTSALSGAILSDRSVAKKPAPLSQELMQEEKPQLTDDLSKEKSTSSGGAPQIRSNFNETAFFYPQLKTNNKGETLISFTVPESNTTWKFRALAYDKSFNIGQLEALTVSRKELMVTPNIPRFIRQGDKTSISTKISNLSDKAIKGKVRIEFFDPLTDKVSNVKIENQYQDFSLEKDASGFATWLFDVSTDIDMLGCRIVAESESFSDGEQHVVPVLPNKMLVTESMTMNINGNQTKDFTFDKLVNNKSNTLTNYRLTLEYANNPAWYAIQALPTLSNPTDENAVNWFASYYANTLGAFITKQYPKVSAMISAWKQQGGSKETLVSELLKNQELKAVLLEETPWVLDAKDETEQMSRLSLLFDLNNTTQQTERAIEKLADLQKEDGGWSWYQGMYSSRSITQYILYGFSQLVDLNAVEYPSNVKEMQMNALKYIDSQIVVNFESLKRNNKAWAKITSISTNQLEYLLVRSAYRDIPISQSARQAEKFYTSVVEKNWTKLNYYERSLLVIIAQRNGNKELINKIIHSFRENATTNDEMGMFWANNRSTAFMTQSAVVEHTFIMQAFKEANASEKEMDMMKQWLLKQKQTEAWESTCATIDAISALLTTGSDWFASSGESKIMINKEVIKPKNDELGTGYLKESWSGNQISNDMGNVRIERLGNGPAWGALYWQYYEDLDKITSQKGELNIDKKLFIERGGSLVQLTTENPLQVGDKVIIRLTVRVDRDMEFVELKDMRASCFEPTETLSGLKWRNNTYYYQSTKDASTNFFFDHLSKGTYVFEYSVYANRVGEYSNGITTIQCMYAPEFVSHTDGIRVRVK